MTFNEFIDECISFKDSNECKKLMAEAYQLNAISGVIRNHTIFQRDADAFVESHGIAFEEYVQLYTERQGTFIERIVATVKRLFNTFVNFIYRMLGKASTQAKQAAEIKEALRKAKFTDGELIAIKKIINDAYDPIDDWDAPVRVRLDDESIVDNTIDIRELKSALYSFTSDEISRLLIAITTARIPLDAYVSVDWSNPTPSYILDENSINELSKIFANRNVDVGEIAKFVFTHERNNKTLMVNFSRDNLESIVKRMTELTKNVDKLIASDIGDSVEYTKILSNLNIIVANSMKVYGSIQNYRIAVCQELHSVIVKNRGLLRGSKYDNPLMAPKDDMIVYYNTYRSSPVGFQIGMVTRKMLSGQNPQLNRIVPQLISRSYDNGIIKCVVGRFPSPEEWYVIAKVHISTVNLEHEWAFNISKITRRHAEFQKWISGQISVDEAYKIALTSVDNGSESRGSEFGYTIIPEGVKKVFDMPVGSLIHPELKGLKLDPDSLYVVVSSSARDQRDELSSTLHLDFSRAKIISERCLKLKVK